MIKKKNTVNFSEIFGHAEKKFQVSWNAANNLFFHTILEYKGSNEFESAELQGELEEKGEYALKEGDNRKAREIMLDFMKENKVKQLLVLND